MRVRRVDESGDMVFGHGQADYWRDQPEAVGQVVESRLRLWTGEWYLDKEEGTPYATQILGKRTESLRDPAVRLRVLESPGVVEIQEYSSTLDRRTRELKVNVRILTTYGMASPDGPAITVDTTVYEAR